MSLKELVWEAHKEAETQEFVKLIFSGKINPKLYAAYLRNQHPCYEILEVCAMPHGILNGLPENICRAPAILADYLELRVEGEAEPPLLPSVDRYIKHILSIKDDPKKLMAHIYVRHMGDLAGGQMISKRVPGSGKYYQFKEVEALKTAIRERITDDLAEEAIVCFGFARDLFKEMMTLVEYNDE